MRLNQTAEGSATVEDQKRGRLYLKLIGTETRGSSSLHGEVYATEFTSRNSHREY